MEVRNVKEKEVSFAPSELVESEAVEEVKVVEQIVVVWLHVLKVQQCLLCLDW